MNLPKVNVVICNYNYGKWILGAISSAINQVYPNLSITVVDDQSTDDSWQILQKNLFRNRTHENLSNQNFEHKRVFIDGPVAKNIEINVIRLVKNSGPSQARNVALELGINNNEMFAILDADDEMYENKISRCVAELLQANSVGAVYADYDIHNITQNTITREYKEVFSKNRLLESCIVHSGAVIKKQALVDTKEETGFYDYRIKGPEDYDLWLRISDKFMILHIPESLTLVRQTGLNISSSNHQEFNENYKNGFEIIRSKRGM